MFWETLVPPSTRLTVPGEVSLADIEPTTEEYSLLMRLARRTLFMPNGCWVWTGTTGHYGHGQVEIEGRHAQAHRAMYELLIGPIPEGLVLDHLCRVTPCVNPGHLEPVTQRVNILRGEGLAADNLAKTACKRGHPFDEENTYVYMRPGGRYSERDCRECQRIKDRRLRAQRRLNA